MSNEEHKETIYSEIERLLPEVLEEKEPVTVEDLDRIFFRAQDSKGHWVSINAREATDEQFDTWARSRITIQDEDGNDGGTVWPLEERAQLCDYFWQAGALAMLKKDVSFEEGED